VRQRGPADQIRAVTAKILVLPRLVSLRWFLVSHRGMAQIGPHLRNFALGLMVSVATLISSPTSAHAENLITQPGAHNNYKWELEPQLVLRTHAPYYGYGGRWGYRYYGYAGVGPGVRVNIPFMHNGPIDSINNNIGISFGASTTFHGPGSEVVVLNLPVAFQWNFYFTDIISVIGETGLNTPMTFWPGGTSFRIEPLIQGGGRFQFSKVGVVVRVGWPLLSVGANFQF
jgi:hypothetical protein